MFSAILRTPPRSILIPYTTLFRSGEVAVLDVLERGAAACRHVIDVAVEAELLEGRGTVTTTHDGKAAALGHSLCQDRKSTRLNSSHRCMSYAVFCLKKNTGMHIKY